MIAVTGKAQEDGYTSESSPSKDIIIMMLIFILLVLNIITLFHLAHPPPAPQVWSWNVVHLRRPNRLAARTMSFHLKAWVGRDGGFCLPSTSWLRSMFIPSYHYKGSIQQQKTQNEHYHHRISAICSSFLPMMELIGLQLWSMGGKCITLSRLLGMTTLRC